jgi:hypothetical protein
LLPELEAAEPRDAAFRRSRHRNDDLAPMIVRAKPPKRFRHIGELV